MIIDTPNPFKSATTDSNSFANSAPSASLRLPINARDVLEERYSAQDALRDEMLYGNEDLIRALEALGIAGPFSMLTP